MASLSYDEAAHALRRLGFGGPRQEIEDLVARGREGAIDYLINYESINDDALEAQLSRVSTVGLTQIKSWWFSRIVLSRRQFQEKMLLFWHNHFATGSAKVMLSGLMFNQHLTLRQYALDRFDTLLLKVAQDPAMMDWLDTLRSIARNPNENFARELQELFTMGITDAVTGEPNYTQKDVSEIARAFTGWRYKPKKKNRYIFIVSEENHDNGAKTIYGQTANFTGEDVVTLICRRRSTGRFLVKRLFEFFVYPLTTSDDDRATIDKFASVYMDSDHSIKALVRAIFISDEFFSARARFALVKNPAEFLAGTMRMLELPHNAFIRLVEFMEPLGLELFNPPDVNGWPMHLGWINTESLLARYNLANDLVTTREQPVNAIPKFPTTPKELFKRFAAPSARQTVENVLSALGLVQVGSETIQSLTDYLQTNDAGEQVEFVVNDETLDKTVRGLVRLILCLPEFQLG
jgi:uncharacterized protein (DUF1800 family)